jgi:hypothetical protein
MEIRDTGPLPAREPRPQPIMPTLPSPTHRRGAGGVEAPGPRLFRLEVVTEVDGSLLAAYCQCWGRWLQAEALVEETLRCHGADSIASRSWSLPGISS